MRSYAASWVRFACCSVVSGTLLTACGSDDATSTAETAAPPAAVPAPTPANKAPTISGKAATTVIVGQAYSFTPKAIDADQDKVTFTIANKPAWAAFNAGTGALTGTPAAKDAGTYANVEIGATDGNDVASLAPFTITVNPGASTAPETVTLGWTAPTQNDDGSPLVDLSGYRIHYGDASKGYTKTISVDNPSLTRYVIDSLPAGKHFIAMTAYNADGAESDYSPEVSVTVN